MAVPATTSTRTTSSHSASSAPVVGSGPAGGGSGTATVGAGAGGVVGWVVATGAGGATAVSSGAGLAGGASGSRGTGPDGAGLGDGEPSGGGFAPGISTVTCTPRIVVSVRRGPSTHCHRARRPWHWPARAICDRSDWLVEATALGHLAHATAGADGRGSCWPMGAILAAARVGGIHANRSAQGRFLYDHLMIAANAVEACRRAGVEKVVVLGSSCIYPREAPQPMREEHLLTGPLEATNEGYAVAKIAALELGKMYRRQYGMDCVSLMPTNLYGPNDNYDLEGSHVLPALIRKVHEANQSGAATVEVWGTGRPRREFLHADDLADATVHALVNYSGEEHLNVGVGEDISIRELVQLVAEVVGWDGELVFNTDMPDGTFRKLLDVTRLRELGWTASIGLREGVADAYRWFLDHHAEARGV
jgi:GDP-L-fucose synthase